MTMVKKENNGVEATEKALHIFILWGQVDIMNSDIGPRRCFDY